MILALVIVDMRSLWRRGWTGICEIIIITTSTTRLAIFSVRVLSIGFDRKRTWQQGQRRSIIVVRIIVVVVIIVIATISTTGTKCCSTSRDDRCQEGSVIIVVVVTNRLSCLDMVRRVLVGATLRAAMAILLPPQLVESPTWLVRMEQQTHHWTTHVVVFLVAG
jgi:hypothetical protein